MGTVNSNRLTLYIVVGIVAAIFVALVFPRFGVSVAIGGEIFLRLLKMLVVPLVMTSVASGILGMGDIRKLGRPGGYTVLYYLTTTIMAVVLGLVVVNIIQPGVGFDENVRAAANEAGEAKLHQLAPDVDEGKEPSLRDILRNMALMLFTENLFQAAANGDLLPLIVFSIAFAGLLTILGERASTISVLVLQLNDALLTFVMLLMHVAPIGIFCLVAARFGEVQLAGGFQDELRRVGWYVASVLTGLAIHGLIVLPLLLWLFTRRNPYRFMLQMSQAMLTAFSTASSSATLPVTIECATENANISKKSVDFVVPLGSTVNMDGTALYEAVAVLFIAQSLGMELSFMQQATVAMTATLASIGAAGIPEAGLFTMVIVLGAVGLPKESIGLILSVDWLLDRFRTTVNVFGDSVGAAVVEPAFNGFDPPPIHVEGSMSAEK